MSSEKVIKLDLVDASHAPIDRGFSRSDCPFYDMVPKDPKANLKFREEILKKCRDDVKAQEEIWMACKREPLFWINVFGFTFDPRQVGIENLPFITYDIQDETIFEIFQALGYYDILIEKSRDEGASWMSMASLCHQWQFEPSQQFSVTSRKGDLVDKTGNKDALFWKIEYLAMSQPGWMRPFYDHNEMILINPEMGSTIIGESATGEVGRGGRNRAMFLDEFSAFNRDDGYKVEGATGSNTNCRIFNGTPRGTGNSFFDIRQGLVDGTRDGKKLEIHWSEDPRKNAGLYTSGAGYKKHFPGAMDHDRYTEYQVVQLETTPHGRTVEEHPFPDDYNFVLDEKLHSPWYDKEVKRYSHPMLVAQELDMDYHNSSFRFFHEPVIQATIDNQVYDPLKIGTFVFNDEGELKGFEESEDGPWKLWLRLDQNGRPNRMMKFVGGVDVSAGMGASNSTMSIANEATGEKLAEYANPRIMPEEYGRLAGRICKVFNDMYLIWENNGPGRNFGKEALSHGCIDFYHRKDDASIKTKVSDIPGWASSKDRKASLLSEYRDAQFNCEFSNPSFQAVVECREYLNQPDGSVVHSAQKDSIDPTGAGAGHGDRVIADALCWKGVQERQRGKSDDDFEESLDKRDFPVNSLAYRNAMHERKDNRQQGLWKEGQELWADN